MISFFRQLVFITIEDYGLQQMLMLIKFKCFYKTLSILILNLLIHSMRISFIWKHQNIIYFHHTNKYNLSVFRMWEFYFEMLSLQIWMTSWMKQYVAIILHWINTLFCMRVWLWEQVVNLIYRFIYSMNDNHDDDIDCSRSKKAFSHANIDIHWQKLCTRKIYVVSAQKKDMLKAHNMRWGGNNITQNGLQNVVVIFMQNYCQFRKWNFRLFQFQRCETANGLEKYLARQLICWNK